MISFISRLWPTFVIDDSSFGTRTCLHTAASALALSDSDVCSPTLAHCNMLHKRSSEVDPAPGNAFSYANIGPSPLRIEAGPPTIVFILVPPIRLAGHILNVLQLTAHLHHTIAYHSRIQAECSPHSMLRLGAGIETQDEIMAFAIGGALFASDVGKGEGSPVCDAADDAAGGEDDVAGCLCDSVEWCLDGGRWGRTEGGGRTL